MRYILTFVYIILTTGGLFCFKLGGNNLSLTFKNGIDFKIGFITAIGFLLYLCSFLLWQKLLATYDLSYIVPIATAIVQVVVVLLGYFYFKEPLSFFNVIGIVLIVIGVILIALKK